MSPIRFLLPVLVALVAAPAVASADGNYRIASPISIPKVGAANPLPSIVTVDGEHGVITDVSVTLHGVTHTRASDLDVLLIAPDSTPVLLMSDACGPIANGTLSFSTSATRLLSGAGDPCDQVLYLPGDHPGTPDTTRACVC